MCNQKTIHLCKPRSIRDGQFVEDWLLCDQGNLISGKRVIFGPEKPLVIPEVGATVAPPTGVAPSPLVSPEGGGGGGGEGGAAATAGGEAGGFCGSFDLFSAVSTSRARC